MMIGYDYYFLNHSKRYVVNLLNVRFTNGWMVDISNGVFDQSGGFLYIYANILKLFNKV